MSTPLQTYFHDLRKEARGYGDFQIVPDAAKVDPRRRSYPLNIRQEPCRKLLRTVSMDSMSPRSARWNPTRHPLRRQTSDLVMQKVKRKKSPKVTHRKIFELDSSLSCGAGSIPFRRSNLDSVSTTRSSLDIHKVPLPTQETMRPDDSLVYKRMRSFTLKPRRMPPCSPRSARWSPSVVGDDAVNPTAFSQQPLRKNIK
jgi:hypothetical protein